MIFHNQFTDVRGITDGREPSEPTVALTALRNDRQRPTATTIERTISTRLGTEPLASFIWKCLMAASNMTSAKATAAMGVRMVARSNVQATLDRRRIAIAHRDVGYSAKD